MVTLSVVTHALTLGSHEHVRPSNGFCLQPLPFAVSNLGQILLRHRRRCQGPEADALILSVFEAWIERAASRRIAATRGGDCGWRHQALRLLCYAALP